MVEWQTPKGNYTFYYMKMFRLATGVLKSTQRFGIGTGIVPNYHDSKF